MDIPILIADDLATLKAFVAMPLYSYNLYFSLPKDMISLSELSISSVKAPSMPFIRILAITADLIFPESFLETRVAIGK